MTTFRVIWSGPASRQLRKLDRPVATRILRSVRRLRKNPQRHVTRLAGSRYYRFRVGDYRLIADIREDTLRVLILQVGHRRSIYR